MNICIVYTKMALKIETWTDNPILRSVAEVIKQSEWKQYVKLGKEMVSYIKNPKHAWVWLAAPQVWVSKRLIVVSLLKDWDDESFSTVMMFNPEVLEASEEITNEIEEGCLSVPKDERGFLPRNKSIKLSYYDERMKQKIIRLSDLPSVIVQHEIDHLNGILYTDRLEK